MTKLLFIAVGGAIGSVLRYSVGGWAQRLTQGSFPVGTLAVNLCGCLAIGFLGALLAGPWLVREEYRFGILVGLLGGFTTFSSYGWETFALTNEGQFGMALANVLLSNGFGLLAVWAGYRVAEK